MKDTEYKKTFYRYCWGFIAALVLVYLAYFGVTQQWLEGAWLAAFLLTIAGIQFLLQMVVFLHVRQEAKPKWTLWSIVYTFAMVLIIVVASLWIMANMNYNMHMNPDQIHEFMLEQNKKGF